MRLLIVDDEPLARARLCRLVAEMGEGIVAEEAGNGPEALQRVQEDTVDVVLLDIRMPGMDGIEVARHLKHLDRAPAVIFTTAYDSHALQAFEASAVDYLLKPIRRGRLKEALERARTLTVRQIDTLEAGDPGAGKARTHVSASLKGDLKLVPVDDVRFFRAEHKYVIARHLHGELVLDDALSALEEEFAREFIRVHRNALAAFAHVRALEKSEDGGYRLRFDGIADVVEVSRRCLPEVRRALKGRR
ncbi:MAG TPA: LytTR family DNA-binding domain-containing protein [Gammaproteobacteria bacterium]|nr:LytTR family DNA-binding domain-containing protein [Gammaproteobacteria bacterium]